MTSYGEKGVPPGYRMTLSDVQKGIPPEFNQKAGENAKGISPSRRIMSLEGEAGITPPGYRHGDWDSGFPPGSGVYPG